MKNFEILLNNRYTATTQNIVTSLGLQNDYYVYLNQNGGGLVNQYNVRAYLNDQRNQQITTDFFAYLTGATTQTQTLNILSSDNKLSETFNDYYQRYILSATQSSTAVIQQNLTGTSQVVAQTFYHPWYGYAPDKQLTGITQEIHGAIDTTQSFPYLDDFTTEQSYYIPIYLERGTNQLARYKYDVCNPLINSRTSALYPDFSGITNMFFGSGGSLPNDPHITSSRLHNLMSCFVDINLETNEKYGLPQQISFESNTYYVIEGNQLQVFLSLLYPSIGGTESATINLINLTSSNQDYFAQQNYPTTVSWAVGEMWKFLTFNINPDFLQENTEQFKLKISNFINSVPGDNVEAIVNIIDATRLRIVSLGIIGHSNPNNSFDYASVLEGGYLDFTVSLDIGATGAETVMFYPGYSAATDYTLSVSPFATTVPAGTSIALGFAPGETQKIIRFSTNVNNAIFNTEIIEFGASINNCLINPYKDWIKVGLTDSLPLHRVTFINSQNSVTNNMVIINSVDDINFTNDLFSFSIALDSLSIFGNEAATITLLNSSGSSQNEAVYGIDYITTPSNRTQTNPTQSYFPKAFFWAAGEQIIDFTFQNLLTSGMKTIDLRISTANPALQNLDPGTYMDLRVILTPIQVSIGNILNNTVSFASQQYISTTVTPTYPTGNLTEQPLNSLIYVDTTKDMLYYNNLFTAKITLGSPSPFGGEKSEVSIAQIAGYTNAVYGVDYIISSLPTGVIFSLQTETFTIDWNAGEQVKIITFENLSAYNVKYVTLQMTIPGTTQVPIDPGTYMNELIAIYPKYVPVLTTVSFTDKYSNGIGNIVTMDTDQDPLFNVGKFSFDVSLNVPTIAGNESVVLYLMPGSTAIEGVDFVYESTQRGFIGMGGSGFTTDFPRVLEWPTIGQDQINTITISNLNTDSLMDPNNPLVIKFGINMLTHVGAGTFTELDVILRPNKDTVW